jgi:Phage integrase, N-terminal SAM-like domain
MPLLDLQRLTLGLSRTWTGFLRDWDRSLRSGNYPETTRYNYLLAAAQLARYLGEYSPDPDADDAADDPCTVTRAHVEAFQAWMIETRSASTALNKHKGLQQFFKWLLADEQAIDRSPMERVRQPKTPTKLVPVMREDDTAKVRLAGHGRGHSDLGPPLLDEQVEAAGLGRDGLGDRDPQSVAPQTGVPRGDDERVHRRRAAAQGDGRGLRRAVVDPDHPGVLPAVEVVLDDRVARLADLVDATEDPLEVGEAGHPGRCVHRPPREIVDERGVRGGGSDDRVYGAGHLLDVQAGVRQCCRHGCSFRC